MAWLLIGVLALVMVVAFIVRERRYLASTREHAEQAERLRTTLASIGDGVLTTDHNGLVTGMNAVAESLTGWKSKEAIGQHLDNVFQIVNEETRHQVHNPAKKAIAEGAIVGLANHTVLIAKNGKELPIDDSAAPIRCAKGEVVGCVLVFRDVTERRRAERTAQSLAAIVESSDDAIIGKDINGVIHSWNQAAEQLFGYSAAEVIGQPIAMIAPPDRVNEMPKILARLKKGERIEHFDTVRRAKNGRLIPISLSVSPIRDKEGRIVGASKIIRDVSERKQAENALREEKARLHATLTGIGDAVIVTDSKGCITLMNPVAQDLTGWKEEAVNRPLEGVFQIINEKTRQSVENPVLRVLKEGAIVGLANHTVLIAKSGTERAIDDSAAPVKDAQGRVVGAVLVFRDITKRRRAEQQLADHAARIESIVNHVIDGIIAIDENGIVEAFNPAAQKLFGYQAEEVIGRNVRMLMPEPFHAEHDGYLANYLRTGQAKIIGIGREVRGHRKDGSTFPMDLAVSEFWSSNRRHFTGIVRDISDRKRAEEALRESQQNELERADELEAILRATPTPMWIAHDPQCHRITGNPAAAAFLGLPEETNVSSSASPGHDPNKLGYRQYDGDKPIPADELPMQRAAKGELVSDTELKLVFDDGRVLYIYGNAAPLLDRDGKVRGCVASSADITRLKQAEATIQSLNAQLANDVQALTRLHELSTRMVAAEDYSHLLDEILNAAVELTSADMGNIQLLEDGALKIVAQRGFESPFLEFFRTVRDGSESSCGAAMHKRERVIVEDVANSPIFAGTPALEVMLAAKAFAVQSTPLITRSGRVLGMFSTHFHKPHKPHDRELRLLDLLGRISADLIENMQTGAELAVALSKAEKAEALLRDADRRKDEFLATLAHELRNPLAPLRNALELLNQGDGDGALIQEAQGVMRRQIGHLVRLVDDLLDISRISKGKLQVRKERVELAEVINAAMEVSRHLIESSAHELTVTFPTTADTCSCRRNPAGSGVRQPAQ
jgi:PAS domain S-box-containing protein